MKTFLTQTAVTRKLGMAPATFLSRLRTRGVQPDAVIVTGTTRVPGMLFDSERLPELRIALGPTPKQI